MCPPFFEVDGYKGIEDEMTKVFDASHVKITRQMKEVRAHEYPKKDLDQHKLAQDFDRKVDVLTEEISGDSTSVEEKNDDEKLGKSVKILSRPQ